MNKNNSYNKDYSIKLYSAFNINSGNSDHSVKVYNSVFNNTYLKKIIFDFLKIYSLFFPVDIIFKSYEQWQEFKFKQYLNRVTLDFDEFDLNELPDNVKHISIIPPKEVDKKYYELIKVPIHLESVCYLSSVYPNYFNNSQPHKSKLKVLALNYSSINNREIPLNIISSYINKLSICSLKSVREANIQIDLLKEVSIDNSCTSLINQLTSNTLNLVKLEFKGVGGYNQYNFDYSVQFPKNLQELSISCNTFNSRLPVGLKSLLLDLINYDYEIQFPLSLEKLTINYTSLKKESFLISSQIIPPQLKYLRLKCSNILDIDGKSILPNTLERFEIIGEFFNQKLKATQLPTSLTYLDLGYIFDQVIDVGVLPANLETLILGYRYSQVINSSAIPQKLKLLQIYSKTNNKIILTPLDNPYTVISGWDSINLYYNAHFVVFNQIRVLRLPYKFNSPLSTLCLQNKSKLEYLHLGFCFNCRIELSDLPIQNNIKTLELSNCFKQIIKLEYFKNLETLIINESLPILYPTVITTTSIDKYNQQNKQERYEFYKLKNIIVSPKHYQFLMNLDINFYQFVKCNKQ